MDDDKKTKKQLIGELKELRQCVAELKGFEKEIEQIRENHDKFTKAFLQNSIPAGITTLKEGRFVDVSDAFLKLMGRKRDEVIGRTSIETGFITEEQRTLFYNELNKKGRVEDLEMEVRTKDGALRYGLFNAVMMSLNNEKYVLAVAMDITERKRSEEALRESEEQFHAILDATPFPIALVDVQDNKIDFWSRSALTLFGHIAPTAPEWYQIAYPDPDYQRDVIDRWKPFLEIARESRQTVNTGEYRVTCRNGSVRICELYATFLADKLIVTFNDITDRKQAEEALRESEERYRSIFETTLEGIYQTTPQGRYLRVNPAFAFMLGYVSPEDIIGSITDIGAQVYVNSDQRSELKRHLSEHDRVENFEALLYRKDGTTMWGLINAMTVRNEDGEVLCYQGGMMDITERKQAEEDLHMSEERFRILSEAAFEAIAMHEEGVLINANDQYFKMFGYDPGEALGKQMMSMTIAPEAIEFATKQIATDSLGPYESIGVRKDGTRFPMEIRARKMDYKGRNVRFGAIVDITSRKQAEDRIKASLREKDILLNEIHHRVKNNMQVISSLLKLQASACGNPELTERLNESQSRIHAMALVHEKLYDSKDFSRIDLAGYVRTLSRELFQSHKINQWKIALIVQTDGDIYVDVNKGIPCGLILNELISNALKHAFPGGRQGKLQILLRETENKEIEIVVRDNGLGLPDDVDIHKPRSLGLDLVNGLVKNQLDGQIEVRRDKGTGFRIKFPL
jgi:PAS domain S-box-containing protein